MPTLEEWERYLKEQEEALLKSLDEQEAVDESIEVTPDKPDAPHTRDDGSLSRSMRMRRVLPKQVLIGDSAREEVAQNSYGRFKETREEMLKRLLDPIISLEDASRILNVCPTTVRRYTNKGILPHIRTAGNQRRFRLSDVLSFLEEHIQDGDSSTL